MKQDEIIRMALPAALCLLVVGCQKPMTNEQIVEQTKYCESNGLKAGVKYDNAFSFSITQIQCEPKVQK